MPDHRSLPVLAAILLSACFDPEYPSGRPCGADGWCPPGQDCIAMVCRSPGDVPPAPDAAVLDGAMPDTGTPLASNADLAELSLSVPGLTPAFTPANTTYDLHVSALVRSLRVTARPIHPDATLRVADNPAMAGAPSLPIAVAPGTTAVAVTVAAPAGNEKTYLVDVHTDGNVAQHVYGKADNAGEYNNFGWYVAIDGDTLAVSASYESSCTGGVHDRGQPNGGCVGSGAVYVFRRRGGSTWELEAFLKPLNTEDLDEFGVGLALDGDTLVVGAFHEDGTQNDSGAAYVFRRVAGVWSEEAYLKPTELQESQEFGWSVAVAGDLIAVGARLEDDGSSGTTDSGAVYLFRRDVDGWKQEARLAAATPETDGFFGYSVAAADGVVVVGACGQGCPPYPRQIPNPQTAGTAYVFRRVGTGWQQEDELASLASPAPRAGDAFGYSVAVAGDTVVIGSRGEDSSSSDSGAVYVFRKPVDDAWSQEAFLKAANTDSFDRFGASVAIAGTLMAVGATGEGDGNGAAYLFGRNGSIWSPLKYIKASNTGRDDQFGFRVALSDDALVVGAPFEDSSGIALVHGTMTGDDEDRDDSGAVYLFH